MRARKWACTFRRVLVPSSTVGLSAQTLRNYAVAFAASAIFANALIGDRGLLQIVRARQQSSGLARTVAALRAENSALRGEAQRLRSDPRAIEAIARRELGLARPDERVVLFRRPVQLSAVDRRSVRRHYARATPESVISRARRFLLGDGEARPEPSPRPR